ncbi:toxin-antitoxin system YwqK family antitoxin [Porphyromonas levii]|uniref:toxin-antitoxin system YwqK family antitoxin n=1 Tax=Porphyromonas levii TaxID=28114 RepID=UPI001BA85F95|nr:toxin-antitoxin system YwqK family antitoxin [Porphyromonas levii]MBR8801734.1 hypothetical protein [Porphyromonas levii]
MSEQVATKRVLETVDIWLRRDLDLSEEDKMSFLTYISPMRNVNALLTGRWFSKSVVRVPEDQPKIDEAVEIARRAKVDPMSYDSPMSLIEAFKKYKLREGAVNPDTVPELSNKREIGYGITVYDVDDTPEGQLAMRRIVDTHFGEDANPWCLLQGDGDGGVTDDAWDYWQHYDGCEKKVAFENGKLIAFCANEDYDDLWWDRQDKSHDGVPLLNYLIPDDELGRSVDLEISVYGNVVNKTKVYKGNRQNGLYKKWHFNGRLEERSNWKNGKRDGLYEEWKRDGQLTERYNWKNGRRDGLCEHWHDNGQLSFRANYKEDKFDGLYERWHPNGLLFERTNYNNGLKNGLYEKWDKSGRLQGRSSWKEGLEHGLSEKLRADMKVDSVIYDMGKEVSRQILNDFTPVGASIQAGKKEKQLNILSPKRKGGRGL